MNPTEDTKLGDEKERDEETSQLNSPKLDESTGKPTRKAVSSFKQAHGIAKRIYDKAKEGRLRTAATVADKYGGSAPFDSAALRASGQAWRNNFSTGPLGSVVDRSTPQLTDPIKQAEFLTYSALPPERENAADKTRKFRSRVTKLVRSWSGFHTLISQIAQEDYLFGNAAPGWIDDDWRPRAFRYDETFLPEGSGQHAKEAQFIVYRQPVLLHDFLAKLEDKETAKDAGYDWEGCIKAANEAGGIRMDAESSQLEQVDALRENGSLGFTYDGETKIVWMFHVLVREYAGGVNLWTVAQKGGHGIRYVEDIHESMEDSATLFTLQEGNMKFYGSKGAGRLLTNLHIAIDRARNLAQDQIYLSGLPIIQADNKELNSIQPTVRHPFILLPKGCTVVKEQVGFDWQGFQWMESNMVGIMNELAGAFIPPNTDSDQSGATTKIEAAQKAERELAVKNGVLGRWFGQFANMMGAIQRKAFKPDNLKEGMRLFEENNAKKTKGIRVMAAKIWRWLKDVVGDMDKNSQPEEESAIADAEAVQCIVDLLSDGLSIEDITELALSPAGNSVEEQPEEQDAKTVAFADANAANPYYDQKALSRMKAEIVIGEDRAQRVVIADEDPNIEAIATRQQITEILNMMDGEMMPVASTDNHAIHRRVLLPKLEPLVQMLATAPTQEISDAAKLFLQHYADHLAADTTLPPEAKKAEEEGIEQWKRAIMDADKQLAELAQQAAASGVSSDAIPPQVQGKPIQAAGPNGELGATEDGIEREKLRAEAALRVADQDIEHRKLDIEEKKLNAKQEAEAAKMTIGVAQDAARQAAAAMQQGIREGANEMNAQVERQNPNKPTI